MLPEQPAHPTSGGVGHFDEHRVVGHDRQLVVEVGPGPAGRHRVVAFGRRPGTLDQFVEAVDLCRSPSLRSQPDREGLQGRPHLHQVLDVFRREIADDRPGSRPRRGQSLADEVAERLAYGNSTNSELLGDVALHQSRARPAMSLDDLLPEDLGHPLGLRLKHGHAQKWYTISGCRSLPRHCAPGVAADARGLLGRGDPAGRRRVGSDRVRFDHSGPDSQTDSCPDSDSDSEVDSQTEAEPTCAHRREGRP